MFEKILIANRGEIALRIMRACRELGIQTVAIYSEADRDSLHVRFADEAYCVGPAPSIHSYLNIPNIISAAVIAGVDAIHPGYGYLAERADFAEICDSHNLRFIGPSAAAIEKMGDKAVAKKAMQEAGVPVVPGSDGPVKDDAEALRVAEEMGYPVLVKASLGGGGKGMRTAANKEELVRVLGPARAEAEAVFGVGDVYIEKLLLNPRHIEIQVIADEHGNCVHLGERECSIQRRHQKLLEEAPSPAVDAKLRKQMGATTVRAAKAVGYTNAGTVEYLLDEDGKYYFMEMNTRVQVEHPVTEMITGIDIVQAQIRIAAGEPLPWKQDDIVFKGHAIECRINAEDPEKNFMPSPGHVSFYHAPGGPGVRVDSAIYTGADISPNYDSMVAKLIVHADDRDSAIRKMTAALDEMIIEGVKTSVPFHLQLLEDQDFQRGAFSTNFIDRRFLAKKELEENIGDEAKD